MATGNSVQTFDIQDVSQGCNYSDDLTSLTKNQSPDAMNVEFFNGCIRKRFGEIALNAPPSGQGGIDTYAKLMLHMDDVGLSDSELVPKAVTINGGVSRSAAQSVFGGFSALFNGTTGYLSLADSPDWNLGSSDFTWEGRLWLTNAAAADRGILSLQNATPSDNDCFVFFHDAGNIRFLLFVASVPVINISVPSGMVSGTWAPVALERYGDVFTIYVGGMVVGTQTASVTIANYTGQLWLGCITSGGAPGRFFDGYMDEVRFSPGIARFKGPYVPAPLPFDTFNASDSPVGFSLTDFSDTNQHHRQVAHLGSTVYAFDRMTTTKTTLRAAAPRIRSYNAKVSSYLIQTYNDRSAPYYWDGAAASMALVSSHAPGFKRVIEFQGYLIGMNTATNPTRCYYQPIGNILGDGAAYTDYFTLTPAPNDDEITDPFLLNGRLYAGTHYGIFRISFVGGVTVFEFKQVISDVGVVPCTAQTVITKQFGQVVIFLGTDKRLYMFDGANVKTISDLYYYHNKVTPIALDLIDDNYKENAFAVYDLTKRVYRLVVTKKAASTNYYMMNVDIDTFAYYPYDHTMLSSGSICYDAFLRPYLVCTDYLGSLHKMFVDTPTDNGVAINEYYTSPLVSKQSIAVKTSAALTLHMLPTSSAKLQVYGKVDFRRAWDLLQEIPMLSSRDKALGQSFVLGSSVLGSEKDLIFPQIGTAFTFNDFQFKLLSDTPSAAAWEIQDIEFNQQLLKIGRAEAQR